MFALLAGFFLNGRTVAVLAERERLILACLAAGMDQQEVAAHIGLSPQRVGQLIAELRAVVARYL